jgi:hypothetical protein
MENCYYNYCDLSMAEQTLASVEQRYKLGVFDNERGDGAPVYANTGFRCQSSEGCTFENQMLWHLELSPTIHAYLTRYDLKVQLHIREFTRVRAENADDKVFALRPTHKGVSLDMHQARNLLHVVWPTRQVVWRNELIQVSLHLCSFTFCLV